MPSLSVISSMATRNILAEMVETWKRQTGDAVELLSIGGVDAAKRVRAGETFDVVVLADEALRSLEKDGFVAAGSITPLARSPAAVAVRTGAPRPAKLDAPALRQLLEGCKTVGVSTGPSGKHVRAMLQDWSLGEPGLRSVEAPTGVPVARLIASGEADAGFQQLSELMGEPGIDIVGPVPPELIPVTVFSMGLGRTTASEDRARALMRYLASPACSDAKMRQGMQPA